MGKKCIFLKNRSFGGKSHQAPEVGILKKRQKVLIFRVFMLFFGKFRLFLAKSYLRRLAGFRPFMAPDLRFYRIKKSL
jgi:hypothetical protein